MQLKSLALAISVLALYSCKKSNDDPAPADQGSSSRYRITQINDKGTDQNDKSTYTYNSDGRLIQILDKDSTGVQISKNTYQYNAKGLISFSSYVGDNFETSSSYTYTTDNLTATQIRYSDAAATTVTGTTTFYYNADKDLEYSIGIHVVSSTTYTDSTVYTNYRNGRPYNVIRYSKSGNGAYSFASKYKLTYDARMNLIKKESNLSSGDSSSFYVSETRTFSVLATQQAAAWKDILAVNYIGSENNLSSETKDVDVDFQTEDTYSIPCGATSKYSSSITESNLLGYPTKIQDIDASYSCGTLNHSKTTVSTITYEAY